MLSHKMEQAINAQINAELYSAYLYLSMCAHFENRTLKGFANWMRVQAQEEMFHAIKFFDHVSARGGKVTLGAIQAPPSEWGTPLEVMKEVAAHESKVTGLINNLVDLSMELKDHASLIFLHWYVTEQIEEEMNAGDLVQKLTLAGTSPEAMLLLDKELSLRVFTMPAPAAG